MAEEPNIPSPPDGYITIRMEDWMELVDDSSMLRALENGGVDNWEWYGESLTDYWAEKEAAEATG